MTTRYRSLSVPDERLALGLLAMLCVALLASRAITGGGAPNILPSFPRVEDPAPTQITVPPATTIDLHTGSGDPATLPSEDTVPAKDGAMTEPVAPAPRVKAPDAAPALPVVTPAGAPVGGSTRTAAPAPAAVPAGPRQSIVTIAPEPPYLGLRPPGGRPQIK